MLLIFNEWGELVPWAAFGLACLVCVTLPYIALCSWISVSMGSSLASLVTALLVIGGVPLLAVLGRSAFEPLSYLVHALPWGFQHRLFHHEGNEMALAAAGCLGFTVFFLYLGQRRFEGRDL